MTKNNILSPWLFVALHILSLFSPKNKKPRLKKIDLRMIKLLDSNYQKKQSVSYVYLRIY
jgi:hypothetical protein